MVRYSARSGQSLFAAVEWPVPTDDATVSANAAGLLTPQQQRQLLAALTPSAGVVAVRAAVAAVVILFFAVFIACSGFALAAAVAPAVQQVFQSGRIDIASLVVLAPLAVFALFALFFLPIVYVTLIRPVRGWLRRVGVRREIAAGRVAQGVGGVRLARGGYVATADGLWLRSVTGEARVLLAPGAYTFYFLPRSRAVVSAQLLYPLAQSAPPTLAGGAFASAGPIPASPPAYAGLQAALASALRFSGEDLAVNRAGRLTAPQKQRLRTAAAVLFVFALALILGLPIFLLVVAPLGQAACGDVISALIGLFPLWIASRRWLDMRSGAVEVLRGPVQRRMSSDGEGGTSYLFTIAGKRFSVRRAAYCALIPGLPYAVYFAPRSSTLFSIEPLDPNAEGQSPSAWNNRP